jgi:hypothetical protein
VFSRYKALEKKHGADKLIGIMQRIIDGLDQEGLLKPEMSNTTVKARAEELYKEIARDYSTGFVPNE